MRTITIPGTGVATSALGFGCADLYREPSAVRRRRLLEVAHDVGIRHFDVAPMYGLGLAERELGLFVRERRDSIVVATKFGIAPTAACRIVGRGQGPARRVLAAVPALRRGVRARASGPSSGPAGALLYRSVGFDAAAARASLERSLRELRIDHVDLLLMHDPQPGDVRAEDVCDYLESARAAGLIRAWGIAGDPQDALGAAKALAADVPVMQVRHDVLMSSMAGADCASVPGRIIFGVIGRALDVIVRHVTANAELRTGWREAVGDDCAVPEVVARLLLQGAAWENRAGVVLFSTIREDHLRSAAEQLSGPPTQGGQLDAFLDLVRMELLAPETHR